MIVRWFEDRSVAVNGEAPVDGEVLAVMKHWLLMIVR